MIKNKAPYNAGHLPGQDKARSDKLSLIRNDRPSLARLPVAWVQALSLE